MLKGKYDENDARKLMWNLVRGLKYLHQKNIIHRDLKLENIMLNSLSNNHDIKIVDYGISCIVGDISFFGGLVGTPEYMAPELLKTTPGSTSVCIPSIDIWSVGIILYMLLTRGSPYTETKKPIIDQVRDGDYNLGYLVTVGASESAIDLIQRILNPNPDGRLTLNQIEKHPWMLNIPLTPQYTMQMEKIAKSRVPVRLIEKMHTIKIIPTSSMATSTPTSTSSATTSTSTSTSKLIYDKDGYKWEIVARNLKKKFFEDRLTKINASRFNLLDTIYNSTNSEARENDTLSLWIKLGILVKL